MSGLILTIIRPLQLGQIHGMAQGLAAGPADERLDHGVGHAHDFVLVGAREMTGELDVGQFVEGGCPAGATLSAPTPYRITTTVPASGTTHDSTAKLSHQTQHPPLLLHERYPIRVPANGSGSTSETELVSAPREKSKESVSLGDALEL